MAEDETSLAKRPELNLEQLSKGGLVVDIEPTLRGSLIDVTGIALERITRERLGENPAFKLPERTISFLDPSTRRLIMISNREDTGKEQKKTPDKFGLFAEIVELDEEGEPHFRLTTGELILPDEDYQLVAIGPNQFNLPPTHIEVEEESDKEPGKKKFIPWNVRFAELQNWMNQVVVDPNENLDNFLTRFSTLKLDAAKRAQEQISRTFPESSQGFDEKTQPINLIVAIQNQEELRQASIRAGLYPVVVTPDKLNEAISLIKQGKVIPDGGDLSNILVPGSSTLAVITIDERGVKKERLHDSIRHFLISKFRKENPVFALVWLPVGQEEKNIKEEHGFYYSYNKQEYLGLLKKLKADLLLTIFLRGAGAIVK